MSILSVLDHIKMNQSNVLCSHSNTPVDELLGKPYQDEMLALIASYQEQTGNKDDNLANEDNDDEIEEAEQP